MGAAARRPVLLEPLEPRVLLSGDAWFLALGDGDLRLLIDDVGGAETLQLVDASDPGTILASELVANLDSLAPLRIEGNGFDLNLTLDASVEASGIAGGVIFDAGVGRGTLAAVRGANRWNLDGDGEGDVNGIRFLGVENLIGGVEEDLFVFGDGARLLGTIAGGGGDDTLVGPNADSIWTFTGRRVDTLNDTAFHEIESVVGGSGRDAFHLSPTVQFRGTIDGGAGDDTLSASDLANTWNVTAADAGELNGRAFQGIENLTGGAGADQFVLGPGGSVAGRIEGGLGLDTLQGADGPNLWQVTGDDAGALNGRLFAGIENLAGGAVRDDFAFGDGARVSGAITGGAGVNTLDYSAYTSGVVVDLLNAAATGTGGIGGIGQAIGGVAGDRFLGDGGANTFVGGAGDDLFTWTAGDVFYGGMGSDTLVGRAADSLWHVTGVNAGDVEGVLFNTIENLVGGEGADRFALGDGAGISGLLDGGEGSNELDYAAYAGAVAVGLAAGTATGTGGFRNLSSFSGGSGDDTILGFDLDSVWDLIGTDGGSVNGAEFEGFENLHGGGGADQFRFAGGASVRGVIAGGAGQNTLDYSGYGSSVVADLGGGHATGTGGFSGIQRVVGGGAQDTLVGPAADTTWNITGADAGNVAGVSFAAIENLRGAADNEDVFILAAGGSLSGLVEGGDGGFDTLEIRDGGYMRLIFTPTGPDSGTIGLDDMVLTYAGLEPIIVDTGTAPAMEFILPATNDEVEFRHTVGNDFIVDSLNLTFEDTTVTVLGGVSTVTIDLGAGNDTITIKNLDGETVDGKLIVIGGLGDDTFRFDDDFGDVTIVEAALGGTDTLSFQPYVSTISVSPQLSGAVDISGDGGNDNITLSATTAANLENLVDADISLTGSVQDTLVSGLNDLVAFARQLASFGDLATGLPLLGGNVGDPDPGVASVAVESALNIAEALDQLRVKVEKFFADNPMASTDDLIAALSGFTNAVDSLGPAIYSTTADVNVIAGDTYEFDVNLTFADPDTTPISETISASGVTSVGDLVDALNADLATNGLLDKLLVVQVSDGGVASDRIAFRVLSPDIDTFGLTGSFASVAKMGFSATETLLSDVQDILRELGSLNVSVAPGVSLAVTFDGGTPQLRLNVEYEATRSSAFNYNFGNEAQGLGLAFDIDAKLDVDAMLVADLTLGLDLTDSGADFLLDVNELRVGVEITSSAVADLGLNIGFLGAKVSGTVELEAGATVDLVTTNAITPAQLLGDIGSLVSGVTLTDFDPSDGDSGPSFTVDLDVAVDTDLSTLGGFSAPGVKIETTGNPFTDGANVSISTTSFDEFFNFNNLSAAGVVSILGQLADWFDGLRESEVLSSLNLPFLDGGLDRVLNLAELLNDALLFDDGGDDATDGGDRLATDLNAGLREAGISDLIRAQGNGDTIKFIQNSAAVTGFSIAIAPDEIDSQGVTVYEDTGGFTDLGLAAGAAVTVDGFLVKAGGSPLNGQIADDAFIRFTIMRSGLPNKIVDVKLAAADTSDNAGIGDDTPKLLDEQNAPTFATSQEMAQRLKEILTGFLPGDVVYDATLDELTYVIDFSSVPLFSVEVPLDFELDLAPLAEVVSSTHLIIDAEGGMAFKIGFSLGAGAGGSLSGATTIGTGLLDDLKVDIKDAPAAVAQAAPRTVVGVLTQNPAAPQDATFTVDVNNGATVAPVTVTALSTANNTEIAHLVGDINDAIALTALSGKIQAEADGNTLKFVGIGATTAFTVTANTGNPAFGELGIQESTTATMVDGDLVVKAGKPAPTLVGRLSGGDASFSIQINGGSARAVTVALGDTTQNRNILDLVNDVQRAIDVALTAGGETMEIEVSSEGKNLLFTLKDETTGTFTITPGTRADQLGITGVLSADEADLLITVDDGTVHRVTLDGATTLLAVIDAIQTQTSGEVSVGFRTDDPSTPLDEANTGLRLTDTTGGLTKSGSFRVDMVNGSVAGVDLGIVGVDANPLDPADVPDGVIAGATLSGGSVLDRFFIEGNPSLGDVLNASLSVSAGAVLSDIVISTIALGKTTFTAAGFDFRRLDLDLDGTPDVGVSIEIKDVAGFNDGTYVVDTVLDQTTVRVIGDLGTNGQMGGAGILLNGVQASANFGFVGVGLFGTAAVGADLSLGFNSGAAALADNRLTLGELVDAFADITELVAPPDITAPGVDFGMIELDASLILDGASSDFLSNFSGLLGVNPTVMLKVIAVGDPFLGTRFGQAGYARLSDTQFEVDGDFTGKLPDGVQIRFNDGSDHDLTVDGAVFAAGKTTVTVSGGFALPVSLTGLDVSLLPKVEVMTSGLDDLLDFEDISFDDILAALRGFVGFLSDFEAFGFLDEPLPLVDKSISDLLSYADDFSRALDDAENDRAGSLQTLEDKLKDALAIGQTRIDGILTTVGEAPGADILDLSLDGDILRLDLRLGASVSRGLDVSIPGVEFLAGTFADLGLGDILEITGSAGLSADGAVLLTLGFGVDLFNPTDLFLFDNTGVEAKLDVGADDLAFRAGLGPFALSISKIGNDPTTSMVSVGADGSLVIKPSVFNGSDHVALSTVLAGFSTAFDATLGGTIEGELPVFFPSDAQLVGTIKIGKGNNPNLPGTFADLVDGSGLFIQTEAVPAPPIPADSVVIDVHEVVDAISDFDFANLDLFSNVFLAIDGLDIILKTVQDALDGSLGDFTIPLVGDELTKGAGFIEDFREDFIGPLRQSLEAVKDVAVDFSVPDKNIISEAIFDLLGPEVLGGLGLLRQQSGAGDSPGDFITLDTNLDEFLFDPDTTLQLADVYIEWELDLGSVLLNQDFGIGFDLGVPGLGLHTDGDITVDLEWQVHLGFGLSFEDGFYLIIGDGDNDVLNDVPEVLFEVAVAAPASISGTLGFLGLTATDTTINVLGENRNTNLGAIFGLDIQNGSNPLARKLGLADFGDISFDAGFAANADAMLALTLGLSGELVGSGIAAGFPSIEGEFVFVWELGERDTDGSTLTERAMDTEFMSFDGFTFGSITDGLQLVRFQNIELNLGSFISDVLKPIVDQVSDFTEPLQPIIDFLTSPIPVIGAFLDVTWLDLAGALGDIDTGLIEQIADIITLINDIAAASGSTLMIPIGEITIYDAGGLLESVTTFTPDLGNPGTIPQDLDIPDNLVSDAITIAGGFANALAGTATGSPQDTSAKGTLSGIAGDGESAFSFPFLDDPSQIFGLLLGKEATLVQYDIAPLKVEFEFSQFFSIFGPLGVSIGFSVNISFDSAVGYDTAGIRQFVESGFLNPLLLVNGFFIDDSPMLNGVDDPELVFGAALFATAELNLGIARAGIKAELGFKIEFDLFDPNRDGKVRITEMIGNFRNQLASDEPALAPLAIFDVRGEVFALMSAFLIIDFGFFTFEKEFPIFGPVTLLDFEIDFFRPPIFASEQQNGDLVVHTGKFADQRLLGNATDIGENLEIKSTADDGTYVTVEIKSADSALGPDSQTFLPFKVKKGRKLIIDGGAGDDTFDLTGFVHDGVQFEIDGGAGNDTIQFAAGAADPGAGKFNVLRGGAGDDMIDGGGGSTLIIGGGGDDTITGGDGNDLIFGDDEEIIGAAARGFIHPTDGDDDLDGGAGEDILIGGGGRDALQGGSSADDDLLVGGGGVVFFTSAAAFKEFDNRRAIVDGTVEDVENLLFDPGAGDDLTGGGGADIFYGTAGPDTFHGDAGEDTIFGMTGSDTIFGGDDIDILFGDGGRIGVDGPAPFEGGDPDEIHGGGGEDIIYGGGGGDSIFGDADPDEIYGGSGPDVIHGGGGNDFIRGQGEPDTLYGDADSDNLEGGAGPDQAYGGDDPDLLIVGKSSDYADGEEDGDTFLLSFQGGTAVSFAQVSDTGSSGVDLLQGQGTVFDDQFLLRANTDGSIAFVGLINTEIAVERIGYDFTIERIVLNTSFGDDHVAVDDTAAEITVNGEFGEDTFQVGQVFRDERIPPNVSVGDEFATIETTRGFLSNGISAPMTINGGLGNDDFVVFHNKAVLQLNGGEGDDVFEIRAFALIGSQEPQRERTDITGGDGADLVQYAVNAPVNIDGGDGFDTVVIIGTEFGDDFVITDKGVFGAGLNVNFVNIESLRVDGAEGNDRFFVKSTSEKFVTEIFGGLGEDTFNLSGDTPPVVSNDLKGHSGIILNDVVYSDDARFADQTIFGISANVADNDEPFAVIRQTDGSTIVTESGDVDPTEEGLVDSYALVLTRAPDPTKDVLINVLAPIPTPDDRERRGQFFRVDSPTATQVDINGTNLTLTFTAADWFLPQTVNVYADAKGLEDLAGIFTRPELGDDPDDMGPLLAPFVMDDEAFEGVRYGVVNHLIRTQSLLIGGAFLGVTNDVGADTASVTITDPGGVTANELLGRKVFVTKNPGVGQSRYIVEVDDSVLGEFKLTLDRAFVLSGLPDTVTSEFQIRIDDAIVGVMTGFEEDAFIGLDPDDERSTFTDSTAPFPTVGEGLRGAIIEIIGGPGVGQQRLILENTTDTLTLNGGWRTDPVANESLYRIERYDGLVIPSVSVQINDNDRRGAILDETKGYEDDGDMVGNAADVVDDFDTVTAVIEGGDGDFLGEKDVVNVRLSRQPNANVKVQLIYNGEQLNLTDLAGTTLSFLTFTSANWDTFQPVVVEATPDMLREGFHTNLIQVQISSADLSDPVQDGAQDSIAITDHFALVPPDEPLFYVGLSRDPNPGSVQVFVDTVELVMADEDGENGEFLLLSNKVVFVDASGDVREVSGDIQVDYEYTDPGFDDSFTTPILARMEDVDAPTVLVRESGGSTDVIELERGGGDPEGVPTLLYDLVQAFNISPWNDSYELVLTGQPTAEVTVKVTPDITKTTRTGGIRHDEIQVAVSSDDVRVVEEEVLVNVGTEEFPILLLVKTGNLLVTFNGTNWDEPVEIKVRALDDQVVDGGDTQVFAPGPNTVSRILGPVFIEGAGGQGSLGIGFPVMLPGEINIKDKTGDVAAPVSGNQVTVLTANLEAILADFDLLDLSELFEKTIEITGVQDAGDLFHSAIGQFRLITGVQVNGAQTVLTLNAAFDLNLGDNEGEQESDLKSYAITAESLNFFVDETTQVDFLFVHDEDSPADSSGVLTGSRLRGLNMGPDLVFGGQIRPGGINFGDLEVIEINLGSGNNDFTVQGTPTREDGYQTWTLLNTGDDIEWQGQQGDTVTVKLNAVDEITATGTVVSGENADADANVYYTTVTIDQSFADDSLAGQVIEILEDGLGDNGGEADGQSRRILGNTGAVLTVESPWEFIPDGEAYQIVNPADGAFAVNTEGGDDTVDAAMSSLGIAVFGGLGADDITTGSGADMIFGDRGRVDYFNFDGAIVTRLGDAPEPILGFVTEQVTLLTLNQLVDAMASFPVADSIADGMGTDDIGLVGLYVDVNSGKGFLQTIRRITANTGTMLTVTPDFDTDEDLPGPDPTDPGEYRISTIPEDQTDGVVRDPGLLLTVDNELGGADLIDAGLGDDQVFGGAGGDEITGGGDNDIVVGDGGRLDRSRDPNAPDELVVHDSETGRVSVASFFDRLRTIAWHDGGVDTLAGGAGADFILGGNSGDTIYGDDLGGPSGAGDLGDVILGDNGEVEFVDGVVNQVFTTDVSEATGGSDTVDGNAGDDMILGGVNGSMDDLRGGSDDDILLGDNGILFWDDPADPSLSTLDRIATRDTDRGGDDLIAGDAGDDLILGGTGADVVDGGANDDIIFGDFATILLANNVAMDMNPTERTLGGADILSGGSEEDIVVGGANSDILDGDAGDDLIFGDNVRLDRLASLGSIVNPRFRALLGTVIYDLTDAPKQGAAHRPDPTGVPVWTDWKPTLLDNSAADQAAALNNFGDDYIAGGGADDQIFAQLGDDVVQGDGAIEGLVDDGIAAGAFRDGANLLQVTPSFEAMSDGDDYIEGNGGSDVVFGNLGQDDIIGGSSTLFSLTTQDLRPDDSDLLFGGAGTDIARNDYGDESALGHARDADVIAGDNANIYRLVGVNGVDSGALLGFNYDNYGSLKLIPRAVELLDYTPGGVDFNAAGQAGDIGAADEAHGESGDDTIYGMVGPDVLFGEGQDDDIVGGYGHDWISGGTGDDGVLGDDGRIWTSRNSTSQGEPLYAISALAAVNVVIDTPGDLQVATINVGGELKKTVNMTPYHLVPAGSLEDPLFDPSDADDVIYGGFGNDSLHGGAGDDAISGAEALPQFYASPDNPGDVLRFGQERAGEFAAYDEFDAWRKIFVDADGVFTGDPSDTPFLLNFDAAEGRLDSGTPSDGNDRAFGDLGNDWIVGGSGRDNLYGGWGNDLLNADDDHDSTAGTADPLANDVPDGPNATYEDRAFGGAGRDVLIGNTGGDRLIDWAGEFNSYIVPFAPFGMFTVSRQLLPQLPEFLYDLSESDGADPTRPGDSGGNAARNGEPDGELGLVLQKDPDWNEQTGAPDDPQPGNIPGGARDILKGAQFNNGQAQGFAPDSGVWQVMNGRFEVGPDQWGGDAASVYNVDEILPSYFEISALVNADKVGASASGGQGTASNVYLIFDYQGERDFKFAGIDAKNDKLQMGHRNAAGWIVDVSANMQLRANIDYNLLLALNGVTATLVVDNATALSHAFSPRVDADGFTYGLNAGMVGIGSDNSVGRIDNVLVQVLPPQITLEEAEDFSDGLAGRFTGAHSGDWQVLGGRFEGDTALGGDRAVNFVDLGLAHGLAENSMLDLESTLRVQGTGGLVFDAYGLDDFKFVWLQADTDQVVIGHHTARRGWSYDVAVSKTLLTDTDYDLSVSLRGSTVSVSVNGALVTGHAFNAPVVDGGFGLLTGSGGSSFDALTFRTNDTVFLPVGAESALIGAAGLLAASDSGIDSEPTRATGASSAGHGGNVAAEASRIDGWLVDVERPAKRFDWAFWSRPLNLLGMGWDRTVERNDGELPPRSETQPADLSRDWLVEGIDARRPGRTDE